MLYAIIATEIFCAYESHVITDRKEKFEYIKNNSKKGSMKFKICQTIEEAYAFAYNFTEEERKAIYDGNQYHFFNLTHTHGFLDSEDIIRGALYFHVPITDELRSAISFFIDPAYNPGEFPADELYELDRKIVISHWNSPVVTKQDRANALECAMEWENRRQFILHTAAAVKRVAGDKFYPFNAYGNYIIDIAQNNLLNRVPAVTVPSAASAAEA